MNPNERVCNGKRVPKMQSMDAHAYFVWENYILNSGFNKLMIIAHSAGGGCL